MCERVTSLAIFIIGFITLIQAFDTEDGEIKVTIRFVDQDDVVYKFQNDKLSTAIAIAESISASHTGS